MWLYLGPGTMRSTYVKLGPETGQSLKHYAVASLPRHGEPLDLNHPRSERRLHDSFLVVEKDLRLFVLPMQGCLIRPVIQRLARPRMELEGPWIARVIGSRGRMGSPSHREKLAWPLEVRLMWRRFGSTR